MRRYWRVYRTFVASSLARELEYKANFFAKVVQNLMWIFFFVMILLVVYGNTKSVAGWNRGDAFVLGATTFLMNAIFNALCFSLQDIPGQVRLGTMDFVVTKPIDTQFWVSSRRFNFDQIGTIFAGIIMFLVGTASAHIHVDTAQWIAFTTLLAASITLFYSFNLVLMTSAIWLVRVDNLWVLGESVMGVARYPLDIYSSGIRRFLTYVVPMAFLATVPASQLVKGLDVISVGEGVVWAAIAFIVSRTFWKYAVTCYSSASS